MSSRATATWAGGSARELFASAERRQALRSERQLRTTTEVVETLGSMKGAFMKLGQMASYLDSGMPAEVRKALASLQADAPPMAPELAAAVIGSELGAPPEAVFAEWDPLPLAAASIGQVHRAMTRDERAVAVKVQYPGVDTAIRADLDNTAMLVPLIRGAFPSLDADSLAKELKERISEELDYRLEARNQSTFAETFRGHPFIHVPDVVPELSTARVLTSELVVGAHFDEALEWDHTERDLAGEAIFRFVFGCLYREHVFNGDPHPGNYLFHGGGKVTFLDYGLVKWFQPPEVDLLADMARSAVTSVDAAMFRRSAKRAGFLKEDGGLDDEQVYEYFKHFYDIVLERGDLRVSKEYASETIRRFFDASDPVVRKANVPPAFAVLQRINLGLYAILADLGSTRDWRSVADEIWPWVGAVPTTELGRAEAEWRAERPPARHP